MTNTKRMRLDEAKCTPTGGRAESTEGTSSLERWFLLIVAVIALVATVRVANTHRTFSAVVDEPAHLAAGFEWLNGSYTLDASHPPLARVLGALPLFFQGTPTPAEKDMLGYGNALLFRGDRYKKVLRRARRPNLFFLVTSVVATAVWARLRFSDSVAITSAALLGALPPVLAHAGLLTTDVAALAGLTAALCAFDYFLDQPTQRRAIALGVAFGLALLTKFSVLPYFVLSAPLLLLGSRKSGSRAVAARLALLASVLAITIVWAGYRFDFRTPEAQAGDHAVNVFRVAAPDALAPFAQWVAATVPLPAPAYATGLGMVAAHAKSGHRAFLFNEVSQHGWWYYFPALLFYKTPLPFLALAAWAVFLIVRRRQRTLLPFLLIAVAILAVSMNSGINIGIRHLLPIYAPLSILAAAGAVQIWRTSRDAFGRTALAALIIWFTVAGAVAHPDYIAYFNETAQPNPASIAVDSNLDWGQDLLRLERATRELHIETLHADVMSHAPLERFRVPPLQPFNSSMKVNGWFAISETRLAMGRNDGAYVWLSSYTPVRRVGSSIRLYHIPD